MPYIRQIAGHTTEARRQKLDPMIAVIINELLALKDAEINAGLFDCIYLCCDEWAKLFTMRQGKIRYYNFNDEDGVVISAIFELMRRLNFYNETFPHWETIAKSEEVAKTILRKHAQSLVVLFDNDRGEAVGEFNYSLSEIALGLINANKLHKEDAVKDMYAAVHCFYEQDPARYEDASITDIEKGDTNGYLNYNKQHS